MEWRFIFVHVRYSMLSKSQIRYLRGLANSLQAKYQIGKNEVTETLLDMLSKALDSHELIKISLNRVVAEEKNYIAETISEELHAELIQVIGSTIILYRKNLKEPKIKLPR